MHLEFERIESLPRLAWCARLRRGDRVVRVRCGPWVEVREDRWVEGIWDGSFPKGAFDEALSLAGTGCRVEGDRLRFVASTGRGDRIHLTRRGDDLFVSNSLVFALVEAGDEPDLRFPYYEHEYYRIAREGLRRRDPTLPTREGSIAFHDCFDVSVGSDLSVRKVEKRSPPPPADFKDYLSLLEGCFARFFANAADPARARRYTPLAPVSRGYDSPALAVLAARHGCSAALTFEEIAPGRREPDDDGTPIAERLALEVKRLPMPRALAAEADAEFAVCPHGSARPYAVAERELEGVFLISGAPGGDMLSSAFAAPEGLTRDPRRGLGGTQTEFRLRVGFQVFKPWFLCWQHGEAIHRISLSQEMRPFRVPGEYDKPIARRIAEEAGIPRELFGQRKFAGGQLAVLKPKDLHEEGRDDYQKFVRSNAPRPGRLAALLRAIDLRLPDGRLKDAYRERVPARLRKAPSKGYLFHWGFHRVRDRYRVP